LKNVFFSRKFIECRTIVIAIMLLFPLQISAQTEWLEKETANFKIIYKSNHSYLSNYLLNCAEKSYSVLEKIFNYHPTEKIILNTFDLYDYGFGESTSIPQNYIHIEIEPFEPGYESVPYNERFQWVINHELVHIFYNDQSNKAENALRSVISKVAPEQQQPLTIPFSLISNYNRYSPVWFQESIAVYLETWLGGGFGRLLGSFDEMFFRSLVYEKKEFIPLTELNSLIPNRSFLLDMDYYLYGARFASYLAVKYGSQKLLNWYKNNSAPWYADFVSSFNDEFGMSLKDSWNDFISSEIKFQSDNISRITKNKTTEAEYLNSVPSGWVSQPFYDEKTGSIYFSYHTANKLASICRLDLSSKTNVDLHSLPTPSLNQVSSTAFDNSNGRYFYTTNNNQLFRDIYILDTKTGESNILFEDERVGTLSYSQYRKTLWGVRHNAGEASIVFSEAPYTGFKTLRTFPVGEEVYGLAASPSGNKLAVVLHKSSGLQQLILVNLLNLNDVKIIYESGNPENPSWSSDEKRIYFNSYTSGVSNIFIYSLEDGSVRVVSNTIRGFFKPIEIDEGKLFAFEFTSGGFVPVKLKIESINNIAAIRYLGDSILDKNPEVKDYLVKISNEETASHSEGEKYRDIAGLKIQTFIPVITGFQSSAVVGIYNRIADPLLYHDFTLEAGYTFSNYNNSVSRFHLNTRYEYKKELNLGIEINPTDFYDLFNTRKRGFIGDKYYIGLNHYYVYNNPLKVKQTSEIAFYKGLTSFSDNMVPVSQPDFAVAQTNINSKNKRRSIGSVDFESGDEFDISAVLFGSDFSSMQVSAQLFGEWNKIFTWIAPHNVLSYRIAGGYRFVNDNHFQSKFFFGGFGNREIENTDSKQFRKTFMFPGLPIYDVFCDRFLKISLENLFPAVKTANIGLLNHFLSYFVFSIYTQSLYSNSDRSKFWINAGAQLDFVFNHWYNLESTLSFGGAKAFSNRENIVDWFISFKLLKN